MFRKIAIAAAISAFSVGLASAAPLSGLFNVTAYNVGGLDSGKSEATLANYAAAEADMLGTRLGTASFLYNGALNFRAGGGPGTAQRVDDWLDTGGGTYSPLGAFGGLQLSTGDIGQGTATTTFFMFELLGERSAGVFDVTHDDGMQILDDGVVVPGGNVGPTAETESLGISFGGGYFSLLYVATNGNPSILETDVVSGVTPVPLPASAILMIGAFGGLVAMRRRKQTA